ncbi:MAG: putative manganese-dependent inorganic diphosphatase [Agathobacter sp.]|nr:putative manganese-dependent inorganic diphosphatase [Agathobacter sp.]
MEERDVWVIGHRHPDTDSICAAIAYADYKNLLETKNQTISGKKNRYIAKRAGNVNAETSYVLQYFGEEAPELISDVGTQIRDISIRRTEGVSSHISMKKAWEMMKILKVVSLPVVNSRNQLEGLIVTGDIAKSYMDVYDNYVLSTARTQYKNIVETLQGKVLTGNEHGYFVKGKVVVGVGIQANLGGCIEPDDLVILGDREEAQLLAIEENCSCLIVTNGLEVSQEVVSAAATRDVVVISTPYETFTVARLINQSMPIKFFMTKDDIIHFHMDDYVDEVREAMTKIRHRDFPVLDDNQNYVGMISRRNLLSGQKKQVILVDHNEKSQAVSNIEEAEILEIIDHHRLGSLETIAPVYFRNQPLGCTSTIIYQMYQEQQIEIAKPIAGLLCAAILSDTLMFRSPTCTPADRAAAEALARIAQINVTEFAQKMFEAGSDFENKTDEEIFNQDFKIFHSGDISFGVAQISAMSQTELARVEERVAPILPQMLLEKKVEMIFVMLTDILEESTRLIFVGEDAKDVVTDAFGAAEKSQIELKGVVSRKKQLIPALMNALAER